MSHTAKKLTHFEDELSENEASSSLTSENDASSSEESTNKKIKNIPKKQVSMTNISSKNIKKKPVLSQELKKMSDVLNKVTNAVKKISKENTELKEKVDRILHKNESTIKHLEKINEKLTDCFLKSIINNIETDMTKIIVLFKNNSNNVDHFAYTILDIYSKSATELIQNYLVHNINSEIVIVLKYELDSNLFSKIKENLKNKTIWKYKSFDLIDDYTEAELVQDIKNIESGKVTD